MQTASNIVPLTPRQIKASVDKLAALKAQISILEKQAGFLTDSLKDLGDGEYRGTAHRVLVATTTATRLDAAKAKSYLTPNEILACSTSTTSTSARLYPL